LPLVVEIVDLDPGIGLEFCI